VQQLEFKFQMGRWARVNKEDLTVDVLVTIHHQPHNDLYFFATEGGPAEHGFISPHDMPDVVLTRMALIRASGLELTDSTTSETIEKEPLGFVAPIDPLTGLRPTTYVWLNNQELKLLTERSWRNNDARSKGKKES
jgi:hypothetical protein